MVEQPTPDGSRFIGGEVDTSSLQHELEDRLNLRFFVGEQAGYFDVGRTCQRKALTVQGQDAGNLFNWSDHIDTAGGKSTAWHIWVFGGRGILGQGDASLGFDGLQPPGAVRTSA